MRVSVVLLLLSIVLVVHCRTRWFQLDGYRFEDYELEFHKFYENREEREFRRNIVESRLEEIRKHNADPTKSWKNGVNQFTDKTDEEFKRVLGVRKELLYQSRAADANRMQQETPKEKLSSLPASVDWRNSSILTPVKDQGDCGSCWSFASAQSIETYWAMATGQLAVLSEQNILSCTANPQSCGGTGGCAGATAELAFQTVMQSGLASEWTYPYLSYRGKDFKCQFSPADTPAVANITNYVKLPTNQYSPLMSAVANVGPIAISVDASAWGPYEEGIFNGCNQTNPDIDHAVQLVGYGSESGTDYWIVRNSWAPSWGEDGYIRIYRTSAQQCGTDLTPQDGTACAGGPSTVTVCGTCGILYDSSYPVL